MVYGSNPPVMSTIISPSSPPLSPTLILVTTQETGLGPGTVKLLVAVFPFLLSVTVNVYTPPYKSFACCSSLVIGYSIPSKVGPDHLKV